MPPAELPPDRPARLHGPIPELFLTGTGGRRPDRHHLLSDLWFADLGRRLVRPFVPIAYRPETYLPFGLPGSGMIVAVVALTLLGFLTANLIGADAGDLGEKLLGRIPAVRAIYRGLKQVVRDLVLGAGIELSPRWPRRVSLAGHVVDRVDLASAEHGDRY